MASRVRIVHGDIDSGKTHRARDWAEAQTLAGRSIGGVLARKTAEGRRFVDLRTGDEVAQEHPGPGEVTLAVGRFVFRKAAFDWAIERIEAAVIEGCDAVIIDEIGPVEMRGEGFAPLLDRLAAQPDGSERVLLVRTGLVEAVIARFAGDAVVTLDPSEFAPAT